MKPSLMGGGKVAKPNVSHCVQENEVHYNPKTWADEYFTTVALESGIIAFVINRYLGTDYIKSISYSTDNGETWSTTNNTDGKTADLEIIVNANIGDKILWKGDADSFANSDNDLVSGFISNISVDVYGNIMSLLYNDDFIDKKTFKSSKTGSFCYLFGNDLKHCKSIDGSGVDIRNAENLILPATTLVDYCYSNMFYECINLVSTPKLPATTLAYECYDSMFSYCSSLTTPPKLPATTLAERCYDNMFATCTSLTTAPELPATALTNGCYSQMFQGCTSLTVAPELPATTLVEYCYQYMFDGCTSLNYIKAMFTTTPSGGSPNYYTSEWVGGVASTGTFVKNSAATWNVTGVNGIPTGWTVETATA